MAYEREHPGYDAYMGNQILIDGEGKEIRLDRVMPYRNSKSRAALLYLWLGRNLYIDFCFFLQKSVLWSIKRSYLDSNMPYWLDLTQKSKCLNVKSMDFPMFRYRVFEGNYINNEMGKLNVINGELRTLTNLMKYFSIPFYRFQYVAFRVANKLGLASYFTPIYQIGKRSTRKKVVRFAIEKRFQKTYHENFIFEHSISFIHLYESNQIGKQSKFRLLFPSIWGLI